ncbi:Kae1-associated serine/threonine protein kinase [Candidatus Woesearchaeota archaeon]|nr:Kae1-associated serine/threonine protein kinase [Candidatus Woesearchaeota archaeon]
MKILHRGAEAILYLENNVLIKERISKSYRHKFIDNAKTKYPTRKEFKLLTKAAQFINVPKVLEIDEENKKVKMEYLKGDVLKNTLDNYPKRKKIAELIGEQTAIMHDNDIIHSDLTTSNMILKDNKVYFIDFGLGYISKKIEDRAVDLHLLKQALESKHYKHHKELYESFLKGYKKSKNYQKVLTQLEQVEKRGRYKRKSS